MPNKTEPKIDEELLNNVSALAQLGNSIEQAALVIGMSADEFTLLLVENEEARARWMKGGIEVTNKMIAAMTRLGLSGSFQAQKYVIEYQERKKAAPPSAAPSSLPEKSRGAAWRLKRIADVAAELQVSASFLRNAINDAAHPLPYEKRAGEWHVKAGEVYDWICKHAKRRPKNLVEPVGYNLPKEETSPAPVTSSTGSDTAASATLDPERILREVEGDSASSPEEKRARIALVGVLLRKIEGDLKREKMLPIADVVKVLRSFGAMLVESIEENVDRQATELIRVIHDQLDVNLNDHPAAHAILKAALCEQAAKQLIPGIHQRVQDEVEGVQVLEFGGEA